MLRSRLTIIRRFPFDSGNAKRNISCYTKLIPADQMLMRSLLASLILAHPATTILPESGEFDQMEPTPLQIEARKAVLTFVSKDPAVLSTAASVLENVYVLCLLMQ